ncbi:MAG: UDP-2,3-diacylglucosamine diphosphatase [Crenarchaeota archaeon]|nr:MAG: UDP-2,3-diacylglucosamine diphosphatase [Thermoproteota archaeon]
MKERLEVKALFVSDIHLGSRYSKAEQFLTFLRSIQPETLYLVGDFIDGWKLKKRFYWNDTHSFIIRRIIGMMKNGTKVKYIAGNHDEFLREFMPNGNLGHLEILDEDIYHTIDGRKLLIIHGDIFDQITRQAKWLYYLGDNAYSLAMWINDLYNTVRRKMGLPYWSLSKKLKQNVKEAVNFINSFEYYIVKHTKECGCSGVICGHIHYPTIKKIENIDYYNCGDWVESCTAIVEHLDGNFELLDF